MATHNYITRTKGNVSQTISSTKSLYIEGVTEYYKIKKELKYEGSDVKLFRKNVKDVMLKRRLEFERIYLDVCWTC